MPENPEQKNLPMNKDEIIAFLQENLSIRIERVWGEYDEKIKVSLELDGDVISADTL